MRTTLPLSSLKKSNRTGVAVRDAAGDEMAPRAGVRRLLNRLSLSGEPAPEIPDVDTLAKCKRIESDEIVLGNSKRNHSRFLLSFDVRFAGGTAR